MFEETGTFPRIFEKLHIIKVFGTSLHAYIYSPLYKEPCTLVVIVAAEIAGTRLPCAAVNARAVISAVVPS